MDTNNEKTAELEPMDSRTYLEEILSGKYAKINVTGWDEVEELNKQKDAPLFLMRIDEWCEYHDKRYFCTTTTDGKLP